MTGYLSDVSQLASSLVDPSPRLLDDRLTVAICIVTDSVADLPPAIASANDTSVVLLYVMIGGESLRDGVDIEADEFYSRLIRLSRLPTTSQPTALDFARVYRCLIHQGHDIVSVQS